MDLIKQGLNGENYNRIIRSLDEHVSFIKTMENDSSDKSEAAIYSALVNFCAKTKLVISIYRDSFYNLENYPAQNFIKIILENLDAEVEKFIETSAELLRLIFDKKTENIALNKSIEKVSFFIDNSSLVNLVTFNHHRTKMMGHKIALLEKINSNNEAIMAAIVNLEKCKDRLQDSQHNLYVSVQEYLSNMKIAAQSNNSNLDRRVLEHGH